MWQCRKIDKAVRWYLTIEKQKVQNFASEVRPISFTRLLPKVLILFNKYYK